MTKRILTFFGYENPYEFDNKLSGVLFSKSKKSFSDKMKDFWIKAAYQCFKIIDNPNNYNRDLLKDLIPKMKPYCQDIENGLFTVCKALYNIGITVIFQTQLTTTQIRGGTFIVNGRPCIVLTDLFKRYPTIWFALIHELFHVLYDLDILKTETFHLTGDPDLFLIEEKADEFSREYFLGIERYHYIRAHIDNTFIVNKYSKEWEIHPSFIYANYQFYEQQINKKNYYAKFLDHFPNYSLAVKKLTPITWKETSISEIAKNLKTIFEFNVY